MSDVKRVSLTTISDVVKKGGGGGGAPFGALSAFESSSAAHNPFGSSSSSSSSSSKDAKGDGSNGVGGGGAASKKNKTVRLDLNLFEPTAESFPEFNFSKLVHEEQKRLKKSQKKQSDETANGFLSDPELDNDVARMARELERKYGSGSDYASKGKPARPSKLDYCDRGAGYDEEDSFIDNSEAYDELIPQEIETVGGGFYINSGQLEFKQLANFERPEDAHRMPKRKKRALSTSSESSDDEETEAAKKKPTESVPPQQETQQKQQPLDKPSANAHAEQKLLGENIEKGSQGGSVEEEKSRLNGHVTKKQKVVENGPSISTDPKVMKSSTSDGGKDKTNGVKAKPSNTGVAASDGADGGKKDEIDGVKPVKTTTVKDMLRAKRDSLRKMEQEKKGRSSGSSRVSSSEAEEDGDGGGDEEDEDEGNDEEDDDDEDEDDEYDEEDGGSEKNSRESGSEVDIVSESESSRGSVSEKEGASRGKPSRSETVTTITAITNTTTTTTTTTNGTAEIEERSSVLVGIGSDQQQHQQPAKERKQKDCKLPDDLPEQLRQNVEALKELARGQSGKLNFFESKVADLLLRIDEGARAIPSTNTRHAVFRHLEAQLAISRQSLQLKLKKIHSRKLESKGKSLLNRLEELVAGSMPIVIAKYNVDCGKVNELRAAQAAAVAAAANALSNGEKGDGGAPPATASQIRYPKKKYSWNERTRDLLWELHQNRVQVFGLMRPRNQTEDEFLAQFMRDKVVPLWPKGWMRYEDLHKELDRRKKALAKSQGGAGAAQGTGAGTSSTGKKTTQQVISPAVSPGTIVDPMLVAGNGTPNGIKSHGGVSPSAAPAVPRSSTPLSGKSCSGKGADVEKTPVGQGSNSASSASSSKRTSDHSIINIMNSPPPPSPMDQTAAAFSNPDGSHPFKRSPATPAASNASPAERKQSSHLASPPDRQRWNSREDDSDSSIEIIAEYNVAAGGKGQPAVPTATPPSPTTTNLPVLNKEKYKNLVGGSKHYRSGSSPGERIGDSSTSVIMNVGKYAVKHHSPIGGGSAPSTPGGVIGFAAPSGNVSGGSGGGMMLPDMMGGGSGSGSGSVRMKDSARISKSSSTIDVDMHQIMKDLKEYQAMQKQQSASGGSRKPDTSALPSQQQHVQQVPLAQFIPRS
uniref:Ubinuclein middle domain-containing protein n=1 Tax=Anopheles farauti TaxID=69004 RepID=A0A182Q1U9_9DIPT